jgi:hypothetical protein
MRQPYLVFARDNKEDGADAAWWPVWVDDGPQLADCAEAAIAVVWERILLMGEDHWVEFAAVPAMDWTTIVRDGSAR